ncbi:MAG: hypothetical protein ACK4FV_04725 [Candidatus Nitrosocaldus sp.]
MLQEFKIKTTDDYSKVRRVIEDIIKDLEAKLHRDSYLRFNNLMESMGWRFFTISIDINFIDDMGNVMQGLLRVRGHTYLDKFANYLQGRLKEHGFNIIVEIHYPEEDEHL